MVRRPPSEPSVTLTLWLGSLGKVCPWWSLSPEPTVFRLIISPSIESGPAGSSREDMVEALYTLIFRLGSESSRGDVVMGILWAESRVACCNAYRGPRKVPAPAVRSGGAAGCSRCGLSEEEAEEWTESYFLMEKKGIFSDSMQSSDWICLRNESIKGERIYKRNHINKL